MTNNVDTFETVYDIAKPLGAGWTLEKIVSSQLICVKLLHLSAVYALEPENVKQFQVWMSQYAVRICSCMFYTVRVVSPAPIICK